MVLVYLTYVKIRKEGLLLNRRRLPLDDLSNGNDLIQSSSSYLPCQLDFASLATEKVEISKANKRYETVLEII